jgi:hypothetical protein
MLVPLFGVRIFFPRGMLAFLCPLAVFLGLVVPGLAQEGRYRLEVQARGPAVQVNGNTQIELSLSGLKISDLTQTPQDGLDPGRQVFLRGNIGYEPKTPGLKKIGPFTCEFQGERLRSGVVEVEAVPGWIGEETGYQFQIFPRKVVQGEPIRVMFRQRYSGEPLVDTQIASGPTKMRVTRKANGEQVVEGPAPSKRWTSVGGSGAQFNGKAFAMTTWSLDIPTPKLGKFLITRDDLPPLPGEIIFEPVEVEVVVKKDPSPPASADKSPLSAHPSGARLTLRMQPHTIQLGESLHLTIVLDGIKVADLGAGALPDVPQPYEWSREMAFSDDLEFTPTTLGERTYGPFVVEFQGERIVSNSETVEVVPSWPRDAEKYEFRIFPRTVKKGDPIRVTFRQQYSTKPFLVLPPNHPRNHDPSLWRAPGSQGWLEGGRKFTTTVTAFDIPATAVGTRLITRDDLPPMDASISFEPIAVEVIEPR